MLHRQHRLRGEQLREQPHHHLAVLEHVRNARGRAQVVLEHVVAAVVVPDQVDAGDVRIHLVGQVQPDHRDLVGVVGEHLLGRDHAGLEDLLLVVDVVQEPVERRHALLQALREHFPFGVGNDARDRVERDQPLGAGLVAIDRESNADAVEQQVRFAALLGHPLGRHAGQPLDQVPVMLPHAAPGRTGQVHLIVVLGWCWHGSGFRGCTTVSNRCASGKATSPAWDRLTSRVRACLGRTAKEEAARASRPPGRRPRKSGGIRRARRRPG